MACDRDGWPGWMATFFSSYFEEDVEETARSTNHWRDDNQRRWEEEAPVEADYVPGTFKFRVVSCDPDGGHCRMVDRSVDYCWCPIKMAEFKNFQNSWIRLLESGVATLELVEAYDSRFRRRFRSRLFRLPTNLSSAWLVGRGLDWGAVVDFVSLGDVAAVMSKA